MSDLGHALGRSLHPHLAPVVHIRCALGVGAGREDVAERTAQRVACASHTAALCQLWPQLGPHALGEPVQLVPVADVNAGVAAVASAVLRDRGGQLAGAARASERQQTAQGGLVLREPHGIHSLQRVLGLMRHKLPAMQMRLKCVLHRVPVAVRLECHVCKLERLREGLAVGGVSAPHRDVTEAVNVVPLLVEAPIGIDRGSTLRPLRLAGPWDKVGVPLPVQDRSGQLGVLVISKDGPTVNLL
mmetsp:Transcript_116004/g.323083  ORF Transcript_116004/g.323083 Transcript_116004/m.323083 type:complete len:244 (-) Transcript_116004:515-1246(-)